MADQREPPPLEDSSDNDEFSDVPVITSKEEKESTEPLPVVKEPVSVQEKKEEKVEEVDEFQDINTDPDPIQEPQPTLKVSEAEEKPFSSAGDAFSTTVKPAEPISVEAPAAKMPVKKSPILNNDDNDAIVESEKNDVVITVSNPRKVGEGMNAYVSYKVLTKTSMPSFKRPELSVDRRFSDFLGLHEKLVAKHRHAGHIVPPAPEKSIVGMTLVKISKSDEDAASINFVEKRRAALERYLNRVARHVALVQDQDFRDFLEQEELPQATNTRALSGAGVLRLVKNVEGALNKITIKMNEEDSWFEEKQQQIENLEQQLRKLHSAFEVLVHNRKEMVINTASFAKSAATLGNAEEHTALSRALAQLSDAFEKIEAVQQDQSNTDFYGVSETLSDYLRIISEIKEVFMVRVKSWQNWQNAVQSVNKKKEAEAKMQASGKIDKISQIQSEIKDLETRVESSKADFDKLSAAIKRDIQRFEKDRIMDFRQIILVFLKNIMKSQEQNIRIWEAFLPEARAIA